MDKQQAAKNYALKKNFKDSRGPIDIVTTSYSDGLQAGWEAHEAQCPGDLTLLVNFFNKCKKEEVYFRFENDEDGYYLCIINRQVFPRVWADNLNDSATIISESEESLINRTVLGEIDWKHRFSGTSLQDCINQFNDYEQ